jgi:conjugal transfer pilus assembly protein TraF
MVDAQAFFQDHSRGWHWYEPLTVPAEDGDSKEENSHKTAPSQKSPREIVKAYREELENRLNAAWLSPTPANVRSYQEMQKDMLDRSKLFSTSWIQNVFQNPELDHTLVSPVNQQGRYLQIDLEKQRKVNTIQNLSQNYGLFFFFSSDCPYCHQFAPIVKRFSQTYGWEVIAISVDDAVLDEFPDAQPDNGLAQVWNIKTLPSLYAVNPQTQEAIPIAHGLTSMDEMENRIMTLRG